jgi:hypothetical protein
MRLLSTRKTIALQAIKGDGVKRREVRMVALRAALVAFILAAMVATFLVLALVTSKGAAHAEHSGVPDAMSVHWPASMITYQFAFS